MDNQTIFSSAKKLIPGGVNSPVRSFKYVGGTPIFIERGDGPYLFDYNNNKYIDFLCSWGAIVLGHNDPQVTSAIQRQSNLGTSFGTPTKLENDLSKQICTHLTWVDMVRMVNSGTEATMTAVRLARAITKRNKLIKFEGCYHGHSDSLLVNAGSGALTTGVPSSPGVPQSTASLTLTAQFNSLDSVLSIFERHNEDIAGIIIEPVAGNMGCVLPKPGFLEGLREICSHYGCLLIMDEVMTGFRVSSKGAQGQYGVYGDITTLGKIIGGGLPVGAIGASKEIMQQLSPAGDVYQAGTLSGNPITVAAGIAVLETLKNQKHSSLLSQNTNYFVQTIQEQARKLNVPLVVNQAGGMFSMFFTTQDKVDNFKDVMSCSSDRFRTFFQKMIKKGVHLAPSPYESCFITTKHNKEVLDQALQASEETLKEMSN